MCPMHNEVRTLAVATNNSEVRTGADVANNNEVRSFVQIQLAAAIPS